MSGTARRTGDHRRPTVADVAREAGVSVATAGRALGNYGKVGADLRERVQTAAELLGYSPNVVARSMRSGGTQSIGFVGADISNPFFATAMRGLCDVAREEGYEPILANSDDRLDVERNAVGVLLDKRIDGIVVSPTSVLDVEHLRRAEEQGVPVVLLDRHSPVLAVDSVLIDNIAAAKSAVAHLLGEGHRRVGVLASVDPVERPEFEDVDGELVVHGAQRPSVDRIRGYLSAMHAGGVRVTTDLICSAALGDVADADHRAGELLSRTPRPTAIFATDNVTTQGLYTAIRRLGLRIPDDVSLVGFDDLDWTTLVEPALTVVAQSPIDMGRKAAQRLFARIKGDESAPQQYLMRTHLVVRGSTAPPHSS